MGRQSRQVRAAPRCRLQEVDARSAHAIVALHNLSSPVRRPVTHTSWASSTPSAGVGPRQPRPSAARSASVSSLFVFVTLGYPELLNLGLHASRIFDNVIRPEIRPYRHCYMSCFGCFQSWNPCFRAPLSWACIMRPTNMICKRPWYIAGTCGGSSCCQREVCSTCTRTETRCSRRRRLLAPWSAVEEARLVLGARTRQSLPSGTRRRRRRVRPPGCRVAASKARRAAAGARRAGACRRRTRATAAA